MSKPCLRCGQCCISASLALASVPRENDSQELGHWLELHRCSLETVEFPGGFKALGVRIPLVCKELVFDPDTGIATCQIYDNRPVICRDYNCKRIK